MPFADVTILNGLPVTVRYSTEAPDPSVGIFSRSIYDWQIVMIGKRKLKSEDFLTKRMTEHDIERLHEDLLEDYNS